jgi:hypothetical protein
LSQILVDEGFTSTALQRAAVLNQATSFSVTVACPASGQASFSGTGTVEETDSGLSFDFDGTLSLDNCDGIDGTLSFDESGFFGEDQFDFTVTINGSLANECAITFDQLSERVMIDFEIINEESVEIQNITGTANGTISASCGDESARCSFNNVDIFDEAAIENSCS